MRGKHVSRLETFLQPRAIREQRDGRALAQYSAFSDLERHAEFRHVDADAIAARVTQRRGAIVDRNLRGDHVDQICLIGGSH